MRNPGLDPSLVKPIAVEGHSTVLSTRMDDHSPTWFLSFLSEDEKVKALKIRDTVLSEYAVISWGVLRVILGRYLGIAPTDVAIEKEINGRPILASTLPDHLFFNVSHSHGVLVIAISEDNPVGIDIEKIDPNTNPRQAASIAFSSDEKAYLETSNNPVTDFFNIWTAKEAVLKATGDGFSYPSNNFSVISSKNSSMARHISGPVTHNRQCDIHRFSLLGDLTGAVAEIHPEKKSCEDLIVSIHQNSNSAGLRQQ